MFDWIFASLLARVEAHDLVNCRFALTIIMKPERVRGEGKRSRRKR
jgi:hypothetical protein